MLIDTIKRIKPSVCPISFAQPTQVMGGVNNIMVGSGFIVSTDGYVCTCAHVVNGQQGQLLVGIMDGQNYLPLVADIALIDMEKDFALLKVQKIPDGFFLKPMFMGDSSAIQEGQEIAFCGFPFGGGAGGGFAASTTKGIISAIRYRKPGSLNDLRFQLDAMTMEGNSGAPLIDIDSGVVLGIINARFDPLMQGNVPQVTIGGRPLGFSTNIGFAIPIDIIKPIINTKIQKV